MTIAFFIKILDNIINRLIINLEKQDDILDMTSHTDIKLLFTIIEIHQFSYFREQSLQKVSQRSFIDESSLIQTRYCIEKRKDVITQ